MLPTISRLTFVVLLISSLLIDSFAASSAIAQAPSPTPKPKPKATQTRKPGRRVVVTPTPTPQSHTLETHTLETAVAAFKAAGLPIVNIEDKTEEIRGLGFTSCEKVSLTLEGSDSPQMIHSEVQIYDCTDAKERDVLRAIDEIARNSDLAKMFGAPVVLYHGRVIIEIPYAAKELASSFESALH